MSAYTIGEALQALAARLGDAEIEDARRDAQVLLGHVTGRDRAYLHAFREVPLAPEQWSRLDALAAERALRIPMSQVLGSREFWSIDFSVTADTLTPRPDSETLIEAAIGKFGDGRSPASLVDLGTGTGCLLVSLLSVWPECRGLGVDCSNAALVVARANARAAGVDLRAEFRETRWFEGIEGRFDLIVSNPPYIPAGDIDGLEPEVSCHEPRLALDGGADGLDAYRAILPCLADHLTGSGVAVLEHGAGQGPALDDLAAASGLVVTSRSLDLAGLRRCVVLQLR